MARPRRSVNAVTKTSPAISDEEESGSEVEVTVPVRNARSTRPARTKTATPDEPLVADIPDEEEEEEEDEDGEEEDVFVVEAIKKHMIDEDGSLKFQVKWEGYDSKKDLTWEPEDNLMESASEVLDEYMAKIGGREKIFEQTDKALKTKKRGRSIGGTPNGAAKRVRKNGAAHPAESTPPATVKKWSPPAGSWEDEIDTIDACEDGGGGKLVVYLIWKNGQKTKHDTQVIYKKCPQKMLQFYERHVKIIRDDIKSVDDPEE
ncbi:hypothetical protein B0I35DRAFT_411097 [Stachybotrys elegans]|uniref:Chromo domain-containing protein n=1 Tax=Stachybotrys elegans TaxID=80388 RepID=A0A8K0SM55_9HYPO|nr:hypothetical protein B0I35DRAFT_411097 [Stachybotrys elegans]